jgi:hypothetical protein
MVHQRRPCKRFLDKYEIEWRQIWDESHRLFEKYNVHALSTGILLNREGRIVRLSRSDTVISAAKNLEGTTLAQAIARLLE